MPSMPQESNAMAGMTPAFMNQPQYQQQMQGLAMQVRQQEEGTKKIKKFLKAYEDIQLSAPMQAPQQPGFMGGNQMSNQEQGFFQPPGGAARSMNNTLPQNDMTEPAPTSFTEMAGGSVPPEPTYEEAPIGEEEAMGGVPSQGGGFSEELRMAEQNYKDRLESEGPDGRSTIEAKRRLAELKKAAKGARMDDVAPQYNRQYTKEELAAKFPGTKSSADIRASQGVSEDAPKPEQYSALAKGRTKMYDELNARNPKGANTPPGTDPGLAEEGVRIAAEPQIQRERVADDANLRVLGKKNAEFKRQASNNWLNETIGDLTERIGQLKQMVKKGTGTSLETDPKTGKQYPIAGYTKESIQQFKGVIKELEAKVANAKKILQNGERKLDKVKSSKPNKTFGIAGMAAGLLAGTGQAGAAAFPPEDAEIFFGRMNADKDFNRLNAREKAAVQKFLEYKAESNSLPGRSGLPRNASDEPIEYSSAEKALMSQ